MKHIDEKKKHKSNPLDWEMFWSALDRVTPDPLAMIGSSVNIGTRDELNETL